MENLKTDILIIGAGPAGLVAAATASENYPDKQIILVKEFEKGQVPCGIPYVFGNILGDVEKNAMPCGGDIPNIKKIIDKVIKVDIENKMVNAQNHIFKFEKLILATGSIPFVHQNLQDSLEYENVFTVHKSYEEVKKLKKYLENKQKVVVIGTGFIGVELAEQLQSSGKEVTIVGGRHILANSFDKDMAVKAQDIMEQKGIKLALGQHASKIVSSNNKAKYVELCDGSKIEADVIILSTGYQPNSSLAKEAGLKLSRYGGIWTDEYMRTKDKDIFAIGDCCGRRDFITRDPSKVMLASTSAAEARVAGSSLYSLKNLKGFNGTIAIFSTMIGNRAFASAGVTQKRADEENIEYNVGYFESMNRHPGTIPDASKQSVKLISMKNSGQIIGGQVIGDKEAGEIINIIGLAIEAELTVHNIISLQVATQPLLTAAPTTYPIVKAAQNSLKGD
ncbi:MAG: FAD-dependent oxidoreductase [Campylobacterota bacterium]|nr:FAD-dependent oxidoreductase [Campylobacterota bacterium]